jgi:D-alanyl-D-alanine carboxypeptidase (penicillin-binding protein 5/6)
MKPRRGRRGRLYPLLLLVAALAVVVSTLTSVAQGTTATTTLPPTDPQQGIFTVKGTDFGDFSAEAPTIKSPSAIVINMTTGKVLYEHNARKVRPMASTTKIMTGILILEKMKLDDTVVVSANAAKTVEPVSFLKQGDVFTVEQLLYALLLRSANSSAVALAEACSGSVEAFVEEMNRKAAELGMEDTHFVNPNGLDTKGHQSTAADMAIVARYAMQNEKFREIVSTEEYVLPLPGRKPITCENTNKLLGEVDWVVGIKTGLTPKAEQCFVGAGSKDGVNIISVVLGQPSTDLCFSESKALMEYGFTQYRYLSLLSEGEIVAEADVPYRLDGRVQLVTSGPVDIELYKEDSVTMSVILEKPLVLPVRAGDVFGKVNLTEDGRLVRSVDLVAAQSYAKTTLGSKVSYFWHRLGRAIGRVF